MWSSSLIVTYIPIEIVETKRDIQKRERKRGREDKEKEGKKAKKSTMGLL